MEYHHRMLPGRLLRPVLALCLALQPLQVLAQHVPVDIPPGAVAGLQLGVETGRAAPQYAQLRFDTIGVLSLGTTLTPVFHPMPKLEAATHAGPVAAAKVLRRADPSAALVERYASVAEEVAGDAQRLDALPAELLRDTGERHIDLLLGEKPRDASADIAGLLPQRSGLGHAAIGHVESGLSARPSPVPTPGSELLPEEKKRSARWMVFGTAAFKVGMEAVRLSVPLIALATLGGATHVAALVALYSIAQIGFSTLVGSLADRYPASRVLAGAIAAQCAVIGAAVALDWAGLFTPWLLYPVYALFGGGVGIVETSRKSIAALLVGQDEELLKRYNARVHVFYEIAGVAGAIAAGLLLAAFNPMAALLIQPPAYLLAALAFWRVRHAEPRTRGSGPPASSKLHAWWQDVLRGAKAVCGDPRLRWLAVAMVLPQIIHRVLEDILMPVFANGVLGQGALSTWMLAASDLGELIGAAALLRFAGRWPGAAPWLRAAALGLFAVWGFSCAGSLWALLPFIFLMTSTWAASNQTLLSSLQARLDKRDQPRSIAFLYGLFVVGAALASLGIGRFLDRVSLPVAFVWINIGLTAVAALLWIVSRKLKD